MSGFGRQIVAYDLTLHPDSKQIGIQYVELDDIFARLLTFPNVVITRHQAFFTRNALEKIACITLTNITEFQRLGQCSNRITV